ncbi:N-acetyltransferase GCN5 [Pandoraea thiooxydans]|uniref:N-acetyltransferase domain-containing protein n=2 Tax=Pandoraea thiooxydans TaxID=445709 RepID=A0A0G3EZF0_9BURK|nr:N-acetyltransferase GCN5 [Pandoraea thiooxydans]
MQATSSAAAPPTSPASCEISCDPARLDVAMIHRFLSTETDWARGIPMSLLSRAIAHSLCFGAYDLEAVAGDAPQVGFARVITDRATFAYLCDVFVVPEARGRGIGRQLVVAVMAHPALHGLRRFMLATDTAAGLYERYGFTPLPADHPLMQIYRPDAYRHPAETAPQQR